MGGEISKEGDGRGEKQNKRGATEREKVGKWLDKKMTGVPRKQGKGRKEKNRLTDWLPE